MWFRGAYIRWPFNTIVSCLNKFSAPPLATRAVIPEYAVNREQDSCQGMSCDQGQLQAKTMKKGLVWIPSKSSKSKSCKTLVSFAFHVTAQWQGIGWEQFTGWWVTLWIDKMCIGLDGGSELGFSIASLSETLEKEVLHLAIDETCTTVFSPLQTWPLL